MLQIFIIFIIIIIIIIIMSFNANKCYWPYVSNLAGSFSKAKWDRI